MPKGWASPAIADPLELRRRARPSGLSGRYFTIPKALATLRRMRSFSRLILLCCLLASAVSFAAAQEQPSTPPPLVIPPAAVHVTDPAAATRAWLDSVPAGKRAKSDAYFEGGYWLIFWNCLVAAAISILLLQTRLSARLRDFAERTTRSKSLQVGLYTIAYV